MKKNKGSIALWVALGIVVLLVGGYFAYTMGKKSNTTQTAPVENNIVQEQATVPTTDTTETASGCNANSVPFVKIISPNGGETFNVGDTMTINFESCNMPSNVQDLRLVEDPSVPNGLGYSIKGDFQVSGTNSYTWSWVIPASLGVNTHNYNLAGHKYTVQIEPLGEFPYDGSTRVDASDALFSIVGSTVTTTTTTTTTTAGCNVAYDATAESKVVAEESDALITKFEKKCDGNYYFTFDYLTPGAKSDSSDYYTNASTKLRTYKVKSGLKIDLANETQVSLNSYVSSLNKLGEEIFNQKNAYIRDGSGGQAVVYVKIKNGVVYSMNEVYLE